MKDREYIECPTCHGWGSIDWGDPEAGVDIPCPQCGGDGIVLDPEGFDETSERDYLGYDD